MKAGFFIVLLVLSFVTIAKADCESKTKVANKCTSEIFYNKHIKQCDRAFRYLVLKCQVETKCAAVYQPVCGRPPFVCNAERCAYVMPDPRTYSNACELKKAEADYLYSGICEG